MYWVNKVMCLADATVMDRGDILLWEGLTLLFVKVKDMDCLNQDNKLVQFIGDGDGTILKDVIAYFKTAR